MIRLEFVGTQVNPRVIRQDEILPEMRFARFKWALLDGLDLNVDLSSADFIDCQVVNCRMRDALVDDLMSVRTSWRRTDLPLSMDARLLPSCHDFINEVLETLLERASREGRRDAREGLLFCQVYIRTNRLTSWKDTVGALIQAGYSMALIQEITAWWTPLYPRLATAIEYQIGNPEAADAVLPTENFEPRLSGLKGERLSLTDTAVDWDEDRLATAMRLKMRLDQQYPDESPWWVHVASSVAGYFAADVHTDKSVPARSDWDFWRGKTR